MVRSKIQPWVFKPTRNDRRWDSMLAFQLNRSNKDLVCPPFHDVDMENKELAQDQEYMQKFRNAGKDTKTY